MCMKTILPLTVTFIILTVFGRHVPILHEHTPRCHRSHFFTWPVVLQLMSVWLPPQSGPVGIVSIVSYMSGNKNYVSQKEMHCWRPFSQHYISFVNCSCVPVQCTNGNWKVKKGTNTQQQQKEPACRSFTKRKWQASTQTHCLQATLRNCRHLES